MQSPPAKGISDLAVLVVDDEVDICTMVKYALENLGVSQIHLAGDGQDAWEIFCDANGKLDLIISDWKMPKMSGLDLLKRVRARNETIPFIMLTMMSDKKHIATAAQSGVTGYVGKPFTLNDFQSHVRKILRASDIQ